MAGASAWMPLYLGDYLGKTARLTTEQHGAYLLLLFDYWRSGPPPSDDDVLAQITRLPRPAWRKMKPIILAFFVERDGLLHHSRVEEELLKAEENHDRRSEKARKAAAARWSGHETEDAPRNATSMPQALLEECPPPSPIKSKTKPNGLSKKPMPDDWSPGEFGAGTESREIVEHWDGAERRRQSEAFRAHHRANGSRFVDWQQAWSTWALNSRKFDRSPSSRSAEPQSMLEVIAERHRLDAIVAERKAASG